MATLRVVDEDWKDGYAYMVLCCRDLHKYEELLYYLELAVSKNPKETRLVLGHIFPKDLPVEDYYDYMFKKINKDVR